MAYVSNNNLLDINLNSFLRSWKSQLGDVAAKENPDNHCRGIPELDELLFRYFIIAEDAPDCSPTSLPRCTFFP